jgi:hypothetical protein
MPKNMLLKLIFCLLCSALLAACTPSTASLPTAVVAPTSTVAPTATSAPTAASFRDPYAYCASVTTIDQPDSRYTGEKTPQDLVKSLMTATGASADAPLEMFAQGTFWRCMDHKVYACFVGANLPCESKANTSQEPTAAMNDFCAANPAAEFIPVAATGHDTIYEWACKDGKTLVGKQVFQVDGQGFIKEIWYPITQ